MEGLGPVPPPFEEMEGRGGGGFKHEGGKEERYVGRFVLLDPFVPISKVCVV